MKTKFAEISQIAALIPDGATVGLLGGGGGLVEASCLQASGEERF
ncbi:MAG: propionate CoA-transferase, partial [Boseongicola sp. SB0667_bin_21]|nr:propionate CoA-transferase [Boseongicola sp. SB0667_bin_21]